MDRVFVAEVRCWNQVAAVPTRAAIVSIVRGRGGEIVIVSEVSGTSGASGGLRGNEFVNSPEGDATGRVEAESEGGAGGEFEVGTGTGG